MIIIYGVSADKPHTLRCGNKKSMPKSEELYKFLDECLNYEEDNLIWKGRRCDEYRYNLRKQMAEDIVEFLENLKE